MTPQELTPYLSRLVDQKLQLSLMLWGPPGIGKSSIVADVASQHDLPTSTANREIPSFLAGRPNEINDLQAIF